MKINCDGIRDLLPLYVDGISSDESARLVEEHIYECSECRDVLYRLRNMDYDNSITEEKETVLQYTFKQTTRSSFIVGGIIASILMIPVIACLIVNLAVGHALDWFYIVLASLLLTGSLIVVPLMAPDKKLLYTSLSSLISLLMLLAVCCIYTHGRWFFIASTSVLMGFTAVILPILLGLYVKEGFFKRNKGLVVFIAETLLLVSLLIYIGIYIGGGEYMKTAFMIFSVPAITVWVMFIAIRYMHTNLITKTGTLMTITGLFILIINPWINNIISYGSYLMFSEENIINTIIALGLTAAGVVLLFSGIVYAIIVRKVNRVEK